MKMRKLAVIFMVLMLFFTSKLYSQDTTKLNAGQLYDLANEYADNEEYSKAIELYEKVLKLEPNNYQVYVDLGYCYMHTLERFKAIEYLNKAVDHYKKAGKLYTPEGENAYYYLGLAFMKSYEFDSSCTIFNDLVQKSHSNKMRKLAQKRKEECQRAQKFFMQPQGMYLTYLDYVNSPAPDHSPVLTLDGHYLYFTSRRAGSSQGHIAEDGLPYEDIYYIDKTSDNPHPINIGPPINTPEHEATCDISANGDELLIYKYTKKDKGDIYYSRKVNGKWTEPVRLPEPINSKYRESHASFSRDGRFLFFTSNRPGGYGGMDIYMAERDKDGNWVNIRNLGPVINTKEDEEGPFLAPDGKTLYFSSKGHETMGGYDVFKSVWQDDSTWSEPVNLGFPINTVDDDVFFFPTATQNKAYYASTQETGEANIYIVELFEDMQNVITVRGHTFDKMVRTFTFPKSRLVGDTIFLYGRKIYKDVQKTFRKNDSILISFRTFFGDSVKILDSIYKVPHGTRIFDYNVATKRVIEIYNPAHSSGKYAFAIPSTVQHLILYKAPYYVYDLLKIPNVSQNIYYDAELDTMIKGQIRSEKYTVFQPNMTDLDESQKLEFLILANFMQEYPWVWVELSAYKDEGSKEAYDDKRLQTIANYLIALGIDSVRIKFTYSDKPLRNDTIQYTITDIMPKIVAAPKPEITIKKAVLVQDIQFQINQYQNPQVYPNLDLLADYLKNNPTAKVAIYGYTDPQGPANFNIYLSKKRAEFVKNYLLQKGVNPKQIVWAGKGFSKEIATSRDQSGRFIWDALPYNRRVEIEVLQQGENELLFVKPIQVPDKYKVKTQQKYPYSILLVSSDTPLSKDNFDVNVIEMRGSDGSYQYIYGSFQTKEEAEAELQKLKDKYPKAFIFVNDLKK